jgi:polyphosphate kinase
LEKKGFDVEVKNYMTEGVTEAELKTILVKTGLKPYELIRVQEEEYKKNLKGKPLTDDQWLAELVKCPKLLQRPIVVNGDHALIARLPEEIEKIV